MLYFCDNLCHIVYIYNFTRDYVQKSLITLAHRYQKTKIDCLRFVMCLLLTPVIQGFFFLMRPLTVLMRQTSQAVRAINQSRE